MVFAMSIGARVGLGYFGGSGDEVSGFGSGDR